MVIFIYGTDTYRSRRKLDEIVAGFREREDKSGMNVNFLEAAESSPEEIGRALLSPAFLGNKRLAVVSGIMELKKEAQEPIAYILSRLPDTTTAVFYEKLDNRTAKMSPLYPLLHGDKYHWEFKLLDEAETAEFVSAEAKLLGANFSKTALGALASAVKGDSARAANETAKLAAFAAGRTIEERDVTEMVLNEPEEDMFAFLDAVAAKNKSRATALLETQIDAGIEPMQILAMLARSVRLLIQAKDCSERGLTADAATGEMGAHPFAVKKALAQARGFEMSSLKNLHAALLDADRKIKTGLVPSPRAALDLVVARALLAGR